MFSIIIMTIGIYLFVGSILAIKAAFTFGDREEVAMFLLDILLWPVMVYYSFKSL